MCSNSLLSVNHVRHGDDSDISSLIKKIHGNHHSIEDVFHNKPINSLIVGHIVKAEIGCQFLKLKKFFLNEVLPSGSKGKVFAVFIFEHSTKLSASVDDYLIIHNPEISKNCLNNFSHLLSNKYEFQVIIGYENKKCATADKDDEQLVKVIVLKVNKEKVSEEFIEDLGLRNEDKSSESSSTSIKSVPSLGNDSDNSSSGENIHIPAKKFRRLYKPEASKPTSEFSFMKLNEISCTNVQVNLFGIIVSVEETGLFGFVALIPANSGNSQKRCFKIFLKDESTAQGKHFLLNLVSFEFDLPPLNISYILRATHVSVQLIDGEVTGCVREGKYVHTFDSDIEAPIVSLRKCIKSDNEKKRIKELRDYSKIILSPGNKPEESDTKERNQCKQDTKNHLEETEKEIETEVFSEDSIELHLESSSNDDNISLDGDEKCSRSAQITDNCENMTPSNDSDLSFKEVWNYVLND